jgi:hypothetical protein
VGCQGVSPGSAAAARPFGRGQERGGELLVEAEEEFDALAVGGEGFGAVAALDGAVEALVGLDEGAGMSDGS